MMGNTRQFEVQQSSILYEDMQLSRCILPSLYFVNIIVIILLHLNINIMVDSVLFTQIIEDYHAIFQRIVDYIYKGLLLPMLFLNYCLDIVSNISVFITIFVTKFC